MGLADSCDPKIYWISSNKMVKLTNVSNTIELLFMGSQATFSKKIHILINFCYF